MEPEATTPAAEPGEMRRRSLSTNGAFALLMGNEGSKFNTSSPSDVKPDADVDDWEAIATDEEKGEFLYARLLQKSNFSASQKHNLSPV